MPLEIWTALKEDHRVVTALVERLKHGAGNRRELLRVLRHEVEVHARGEEAAIYPALAAIPGIEPLIEQAIAAHRAMRRLVLELERAPEAGEDAGWRERLEDLAALLHHYVEEEEEKIIAYGRHKLPAHTVEHMKHRFVAAKDEAECERTRSEPQHLVPTP